MQSQQKNGYPAVQKQVPANAKQPGQYPIQDAPPPYASVVVQPQTAVIMTQQPVVMEPPPNYFTLSLLTCLFCCWPISIFALLKSSEVNSSYAVGDMERAQKASETARRYSIYSIAAGSIIEIAIIALVVIRFTVQFSSTTRYT